MSARSNLAVLAALLLASWSSSWAQTGPTSAKTSATADGARVTSQTDRPPRRIAVLPAFGEGASEHKEDVRTAVFNNLSSKSFELLKPFAVDDALAVLAHTDGIIMATASPDTLAKKLDVDGLIFLDVPAVSRIYAGPYAEQTVKAKVRLYSVEKKAYIWEKDASETDREGGGGLTILSLLTSAVTSAFVLTDSVRRALIDRLGRSATGDIPVPEGATNSVAPPRIDTALSNAFEGPFKAGDEVRVVIRGESGLAATFTLGSKVARQRAEERGHGEYIGRYVVQEGDNAENLVVVVNALRPKDRAQIEWRVSGGIGLDTVPPKGVSGFRGKPVKEGMRLSWDAPVGSAEKIKYSIERADAGGTFQKLGDVEVTEFLDTSVAATKSYFYRISAVDAAKNRSPPVQVKVTHVSPGPTKVTGDVSEDTTWYAFGSPYVIEGIVRVLPQAALTLEPGAIVEFAPKGTLDVLGRINAVGRKDGVIQLSGSEWKLLIKSGGKVPNRFEHIRASGAQSGIFADGGNAHFEHAVFNGMEVALRADNNAELELNHVAIDRAQTGLAFGTARVRATGLRISGCEIGIAMDKQGFTSVRTLTLDGNQKHATSEGNVVLDDVNIVEKDFLALSPKLSGVRINWLTVPEENNIRNRWLDGHLREIAGLLSARRWSDALARIEAIEKDAEGSLRAIRAGLATLSAAKEGSESNPFSDAIRRVEKARGGSTIVFLQEASSPYRTNISDGVMVDLARPRFAAAFLDAYYPNRLQASGTWTSKVPARIQASQVILVRRQGAIQRYWVAYVIDGAAIEQDLLLAGAIVKENNTLRIGVLNNSDSNEALQKVTATLDRHKFRHLSLGQGGYGDPVRKLAAELGTNLVLEVVQATKSQNSSLSASLKQIESKLTLTVYDPASDRVVHRYSGQSSVADFRLDAGTSRALGEAYTRIEGDAIRGLWATTAQFERRQAASDEPAGAPGSPATAIHTNDVGQTAKQANR